MMIGMLSLHQRVRDLWTISIAPKPKENALKSHDHQYSYIISSVLQFCDIFNRQCKQNKLRRGSQCTCALFNA